MDALHYFLVLVGVTYGITQSAIVAPLRLWVSRLGPVAAAMIYCPTCIGFWVGVVMAAANFFPFDTPHPIWAEMLDSGVVAMGAMYLISLLSGGNPSWEAEAPFRGDANDVEDE